MNTRRRTGSRFTFSLSEILSSHIPKVRKLRTPLKPHTQARRFEDNLRIPLALLNRE